MATGTGGVGAGGANGTGGADDGSVVQSTPATCGNRIVDSGELCDDGNTNDGDACENDCRRDLCGNGAVDPGETCDVSAPQTAQKCVYLSKACGPQASCVGFHTWDEANCRRLCEPYTIAQAGPDDHCCPPGGAADPDCPPAYPFTKIYRLTAPANSTSLHFGLNGDPPELYIPLAPGSCGPIVMTAGIDSGSFFASGYHTANLEVYPWYSGEGTAGTIQIEMGLGDPTPRPLLFAVDRANAVFTGQYTLSYCTNGVCDSMGSAPSGTLRLRFAEFLPEPVAPTAVAPADPRIAGNEKALFIAYRDTAAGADSIQLTAGSFSGPYSYYMGVPRWQKAFAPISISTAGATLEGPELTYAANATGIAAHVVWIENGTTLMHARVDDVGAVVGVQSVHTGTALAEPRIASLSQTTMVLGFTESVGGLRRLRGITVDASGAVVAPVADLSDSTADVVDPDLAPPGQALWTAVWIDQRTGKREVYLRKFQANSLTPAIAGMRVDPAAVAPAEVRVRQMGISAAVFWTDQRDGYRAIRGTTVNTVADVPSLLLSRAGEDSHTVSVERLHPAPVGYTSVNAGRVLVGWHTGASGDQVRFARSLTTTNGMILDPSTALSLACETQSTSSLAVFETGTVAYNQSWEHPVLYDAVAEGVWIQDGALVAQTLPSSFFGRTTATCTPGQFLCVSDREVHKCHGEGYGTTLVETCAWPERCDAAAGRCACVPGPACNGTVATACTASGTYAPGGTNCAASGLSCVDGACVAPMFVEDFEDGDYAGWRRGDWVVSRTVDATVGANGTAHSLQERGGGAGSDDGLYQEFTALRPSTISLWMRSEAANQGRVTTTLSGVEGDFSVEISAQRVTNGAAWQSAAQNNQWYHVEFRNFDWDAHTYDFYVDGVLIQAGATTNGATALRRMTLAVGTVNATSRGWWDEILIR